MGNKYFPVFPWVNSLISLSAEVSFSCISTFICFGWQRIITLAVNQNPYHSQRRCLSGYCFKFRIIIYVRFLTNFLNKPIPFYQYQCNWQLGINLTDFGQLSNIGQGKLGSILQSEFDTFLSFDQVIVARY